MKKQISSGPAQILDAGFVTAFWGSPLTITYTVMEQEFTLGFRFLNDPDAEGPRVDTEELAAGVRFHCFNFDDHRGRGTALPVLLGDLGEQLLFVHFRAFRFGRTDDHTLHWTIYLVDKGEAGWSPRG